MGLNVRLLKANKKIRLIVQRWECCVGWVDTLDKIGLRMNALERKLG